MENLTDWLYHHKTLLIVLIILILGSIGSAFALNYDSNFESQDIVGDAGITEKEPKEPTIIDENSEYSKSDKPLKSLWSVDIKGQINKPGVYQIEEGTRIYEIIELAGGLLSTATTENINLSKKASDEMVIYIFSKEEFAKQNMCEVKNKTSAEISEEIKNKKSIIEEEKELKQDLKISLNQATLEELMTLDGIGNSKAENIIKYREEHGGFKDLEELKEISGIGDSIYEKVKDKIKL